jgi:uncharacterized iron-regulated membrane protein
MLTPTTIRIWHPIHRWTSLICTLFLLMLCVTGLPLIFDKEIDDLIGDGLSVPPLPAGTPAASLDQVVAAAQQRYPHEFVQFFVWDQDRPELIKLAMAPVLNAQREELHRLVIDARTAQVLDEPTAKRTFTGMLLELHAEMFMGVGGGLFLGAMGLLLAAAIVSGIVLYAPFMRRLAFGTVRKDRSARTRWLDLHNLLGIVTVAWALVVGTTGLINTLAKPLFDIWRAQELPRLLAPYRDKTIPAQLGSAEAAVAVARRALPDMKVTSVIFPTSRFGSPRHYLIWTRGKSAVASRLFTPVLVDAETGELVSARDLPWYLRVLEVSRPLHFGDYGGLPLKVIWALLDLLTIAVLGSGLYLWLVRSRTAVGGPLAEFEQADSGRLAAGVKEQA